MKQRNIAIGIVVVLVLMAVAPSASVQPKLTLTTDKSTYNWNEAPQITINNAGNTSVIIDSGTLQITNSSGVIDRKYIDVVLSPKSSYTVQLDVLPAGKYKVVLVYSLESNRNIRYNFSSNVFVVSASPFLTTVVYGGVQGVKFNVTNPGTQPIDLSLLEIQVYTDTGMPLYDPFSVYPSYYPLQPNTSYEFTWGIFGGIPAGTYQAKMKMVIDDDLFTVK